MEARVSMDTGDKPRWRPEYPWIPETNQDGDQSIHGYRRQTKMKTQSIHGYRRQTKMETRVSMDTGDKPRWRPEYPWIPETNQDGNPEYPWIPETNQDGDPEYPWIPQTPPRLRQYNCVPCSALKGETSHFSNGKFLKSRWFPLFPERSVPPEPQGHQGKVPASLLPMRRENRLHCGDQRISCEVNSVWLEMPAESSITSHPNESLGCRSTGPRAVDTGSLAASTVGPWAPPGPPEPTAQRDKGQPAAEFS
ncbi:unnamed protein product [Boreogadus saida]